MQELDIYGNVQNLNWDDIEEMFPNLRYMSATGIYDIGEAKNIYTEEYADSDRKRFYLPGTSDTDGNFVHNVTDIANKSTVITMKFLIIGTPQERQTTITNFENYVRKGVHRYFDDARNQEFDFIVTDAIKVSDEKWHGSTPYVEIEVKMQNLNGSTRPH
jgi:hypothetical protein